MQTASIVSTRLGLDPANVIYDVRLKERDCAVYSGQLVTKVFSRTETDLVAGGMEPYSMFQNRLKAFYDELLLQVVAPTIVVTHSGNVEPLMEIANVDKEYTLEANNFIRLA
jgi:broad specificity phosphatase PhoE